MGVFRRHEPAKELNTTLGGFVVRTDAEDEADESCWFCGRVVESDSAVLTIEPSGTGDPIRGSCHLECADRARGLLAPSA